MTKRKQPEQQVDTPGTLMDAYGNPGLVSAGELITSAWGNSVAGRVVLRFPNTAALLASSAPSGTLAVSLDNNVVWVIDANGWHTTTLGTRINFRVTGGGTGQSIPSSTVTNCTWAFETDPYNVVTAGVFTVPTNWQGRYQFEWAVRFNGPASGSSSIRQVWLSTSGGALIMGHTLHETTGATLPVYISGAASTVAVAGQQFVLQVQHDKATAVIVNPTADEYFQGYYAGPY